jgi:hypothetical protein
MTNVSQFRTPIRSLPTASDLGLIPLARAGEYELSDREVKATRRLIYSINKDGIRRFRTLLDGPILMVWRVK